MNIHLPAILMFTRGTRFWHTAKWWWDYPIVHHWCYPKQWKTPKLSTFPFSSSSERLPNNLWWGVVWWVSQASCDLINILTHHYLSKPEPGPTAHHVSIIWSGFGSFSPKRECKCEVFMDVLCTFCIILWRLRAVTSMLIVRPRSVLGGLPVAHWSSSPAAPNSSMFELRWSSGFSGFPRSCGGLDNAPSIVRSTQDLSRDHKTRRILVSNLPDAGDIVQATVQLEMIVVLWFLLTDPTVRVFQPRSHGLQMVFGVRRVCCQQLVDHGQAHTLIWWFLKHAGLFVYVHVHLDDPTAVTVFFSRMD